jgi:AraC-like DNA-binding protein
MLTYNMDVEPRSVWLRTTPGVTALAQPYYCTEAGLFYGRGHFSTARTDKESYLLFYTVEGAGLVEQNGVSVLLEPRSALLLDCRTPQSYCTAPGHACWHHYWAHVDGAGVRAAEALLGQGRLLPARLPLLAVREPFETLLSCIEHENVDSVMRSGLAVHSLLAAIVHEHYSVETGPASSNRELVLQAAAHIRAHSAQALNLDEMLAATHVSKSYFLRLFRQYMGTTPYNFLVCYRITCAKELLVTTDLPVGEVAQQVGFSGISNFSARFSAMTGQSPLQYRKSASFGQGIPG